MLSTFMIVNCISTYLLQVMLIHQVVFSECDSKTKTYNRLTKSNVDGFQRKERQAPIGIH